MSKFVLPQTRRGWFQNLLDGIGELVQSRFLESAEQLIAVARAHESQATEAQKANLYFHHGNVEVSLGRIQSGLDMLDKACKFSPEDAFLRINTAITLMNYCHFRKANEYIQGVLNHPDYGARAWQCYYYISRMQHEDGKIDRERVVQEYGAYLLKRGLVGPEAVPMPSVIGRKIRIGYIHSRWSYPPHQMALLPLLQNHDRQRFGVYCYSSPNNYDVMPSVYEGLVDGWSSLANLNSEQAYDFISKDKIDILVDLDGFSTATSVELYARRPAPILVSWFGALSSHGCRLFDYIIADPIVCPPAGERHFQETILRLPNSYLAFSESQVSGDVAESPCVSNGYVTFGSCNRPDKLHQSVIDCWARIVQQTPKSRLALYHASYATDFWRDRLQGLLAKAGLPPERYSLAIPPLQEQATEGQEGRSLGYDQIDIVLDSFPFNAMTTTFEALRFGVPVVTWRGDEWQARIGASLLTAAGLTELIAENLAGYERLAVGLATDPARLAALRQQVRQRLMASSLVDTKGFAGHLEALYDQMIAERS